MASDLISRKRLLADLRENKTELERILDGLSCEMEWRICEGQVSSWAEVIMRVQQAPAVDAVEVVRCKDCIHRIRESWAKCTGRRPDEFCSDGERRFKDATE